MYVMVLFVQSMIIELIIFEMAGEVLLHNTGVLDCHDIMNNIILAEYDIAIPTYREMFQ